MSKFSFLNPAVVGAGTMGIGIIEVLAGLGLDVMVYEQSNTVLEKNVGAFREKIQQRIRKGKLSPEQGEMIQKRVRVVSQFEDLQEADIVIEAVTEHLGAKQGLFSKLSQIVSPRSVLASNTSSLSITEIAAVVRNPERVVGLHFFNPVPRMPLVEVISGVETDQKVVQEVINWAKEIGKVPVRVKDAPGFLVNRVARPFHLESYRFVSEGLATKEQVDRILRSAGFKMGPFELQDLIGIDINYAVSSSVFRGFHGEPRFRPHYQQQRMVGSGALGRKTGKGHYRYEK